MRVHLYLLTHSFITALASSYTGAPNLHRTKCLPSHWCQIRPFSAKCGSGAIDLSTCTLWLVVWFLGDLGGQFSWNCSSYGVAILCSSFTPTLSSSSEVPRLSPMVSSEYLHIYLSGAGRNSQGTAMPGSCQQVLLDINNSVWVWCLQMGWIPRWGSLWVTFPSVSALLFVPAFPFDTRNSGLSYLRWVGGPIPKTGVGV